MQKKRKQAVIYDISRVQTYNWFVAVFSNFEPQQVNGFSALFTFGTAGKEPQAWRRKSFENLYLIGSNKAHTGALHLAAKPKQKCEAAKSNSSRNTTRGNLTVGVHRSPIYTQATEHESQAARGPYCVTILTT